MEPLIGVEWSKRFSLEGIVVSLIQSHSFKLIHSLNNVCFAYAFKGEIDVKLGKLLSSVYHVQIPITMILHV